MPLLAYFITFRTYGTWLHGDERGSVDDEHNQPGHPLVGPNARRERFEASILTRPPFVLCDRGRGIVEAAIRAVCTYRDWRLLALNVRTNHVHAVVSAAADAPKVLHDLKAWPTRRLVEAGIVENGQSAWGRHGSTRYLNTNEAVLGAVDYVNRHQE